MYAFAARGAAAGRRKPRSVTLACSAGSSTGKGRQPLLLAVHDPPPSPSPLEEHSRFHPLCPPAMADHQQLLVKSALESIGSALSLLESLSAIPPADAALIRSRLPGSTTNPTSVHSPGGSLIDLGQSNGAGGGSSSSSSPYPAPIYGQNPPQHGGAGAYRAPPPLPNRTGGLYEARAAWDYEASVRRPAGPNLQGRPLERAQLTHLLLPAQAADDLPFRKGDLICVTEEPNNDWHKGFVTSNPSRVGLFPATYVVRQCVRRFRLLRPAQ
jgi:hypothetical protein